MKALDKLHHRGPDEKGYVEQPEGRPAALGHTRLSIMDLDHGTQPFKDDERGIHAVCNGEIYNHEDIRSAAAGGGYTFRTQSDCESLIPLYREGGVAAMRRLDGMFAFLISDGERFVAGRDPIGIKPLYYGHAGEAMIFSSEAKSLVGEVDAVHEFPNGHFYESGKGFVKYYDVPNPDESEWLTGEADILAKINQTLSAAVRKRMMADVPVGIFLSGGLDSSLIAALARPHVEKLYTFAVGMESSQDLKAAREVAAHIDSEHHEVVFQEGEFRESLRDIIYHLESWDPALVRSAIPNWFVAKLARETDCGGLPCKVVLTGEGADELFAGYRHFKLIEDPAALQVESRRLLSGLHNLNLQRVDRMTMAHAIEARVPFLDTDMIDLGMRIHPSLKLHSRGGLEKKLLRDAFKGLLPDHLLYRVKMEFGQGSTVGDWLEKLAANEPGGDAPARQKALFRRLFDESLAAPFADGAIGSWRGPLL